MTPDIEALGRRALACSGRRWMPGMLHRNWRNFTRVTEEHADYRWDGWPDLSDPATLGCMLALVAEAYGVTLDDVHVVRTTGMVWSVWIFRADDSSYRVATHEPSRAEALVAALEAAP